MAGYIFSLDNTKSLGLYTTNGIYATKLSAPSRFIWGTHHEGTFADYATMKEGDNVYFFIKRKIYGIGKLVNLGKDCKYFNYPEAGKPNLFNYMDVKETLLWDEGDFSVNQRCVCFFEPDPHFFRIGIDMDDVLSSHPSAFKMLRAFWKLSFIKFDDDENQAFRDILLKRNQIVLSDPGEENGIFNFEPNRAIVLEKLTTGDYSFMSGIKSVLAGPSDGNKLRHEMAIEAGILNQLSTRDSATCSVLGEWDYLSHQVIASPMKPVDYMDKMDLFGYAYIPSFQPTKARVLVGEIKKDGARVEDVDQLLKYVDWVRDEYCFGDYSMIRAFLVAFDYKPEIIQHRNNVGLRKYTIGVRPAKSLEWNELFLVRYSYNENDRKLDFQIVD